MNCLVVFVDYQDMAVGQQCEIVAEDLELDVVIRCSEFCIQSSMESSRTVFPARSNSRMLWTVPGGFGEDTTVDEFVPIKCT